MATNMAPHNLRKGSSPVPATYRPPEATLKDIMKFIPGPDLPTGGTIVGSEASVTPYETGRGTFKPARRSPSSRSAPRKQGIVVTELPYTVGPEKASKDQGTASTPRSFTGISDVVDLTDRTNGLRLPRHRNQERL